MINVTSRRIGGEGHYVGRGTPLGNPFVLAKGAEAGSTLANYKRWLWEQITERREALAELQLLVEKVRAGEEVTLVCWCVKEENGAQPCHAYTVKAAVEWLLSYELPGNPFYFAFVGDEREAILPPAQPRDERGRFTKTPEWTEIHHSHPADKLAPGELDPRD